MPKILPRLGEAFCYLKVFGDGSVSPEGVVVGDYDMGSEVTDCRSKNFSGVDKVGIERADGNYFPLYFLIAAVQKKYHKMLFLVVTDVF